MMHMSYPSHATQLRMRVTRAFSLSLTGAAFIFVTAIIFGLL